MIPRKLPYQQFLKSFEFASRPAVNLLVEREVYETSRGRNGKFRKLPIKEVLLTKRQKPPFAGSWHLPGSFILKGESLMDCAKWVAKEELGVKVENIKLAGAFNDIAGDPRGHVVDLVYRCKIIRFKRSDLAVPQGRTLQPIGDTAEIRFFQKLPKNIGFNHRETLKKLGYA